MAVVYSPRTGHKTQATDYQLYYGSIQLCTDTMRVQCADEHDYEH